MPEPWWRLRSFAEAWYPSAEAAWLLEAEAAGLWEPSQRSSATSNQECEKVPGYLGHLGDGRGYVVHLCVESRQRSATLRAHYHGSTVPDSALEHTWTDGDRLTAEQIRAGIACRGCGALIIDPAGPVDLNAGRHLTAAVAAGGTFAVDQMISDEQGRTRPVMYPIPMREAVEADYLLELPDGRLQVTDEGRQAARLHGEDEARYVERHADCHASSWSVSGGASTHCMRCCAPPPAPESAMKLVAKVLLRSFEEDAERARRWAGTRGAPPDQARLDYGRQTADQRRVARLRKEAEALGYRLERDDPASP
jgi:hypothetical protein